ncbi:23S rRNA (Uracil-5-)-methyltransferase RumA [Alteracholeplasma palmae J233]|uniref:23S rRNA (Uracil-5-)-methyltransferase RumA n=1 Tax=Alteracholeplasma palmae (strain ATCC 49389 / J233) TaxID=1318466 RepID=U4KQI4_ALTPJ|nr:23S rRNA (uracil(1939)-C(5))-methyltransferase RlmD [Alteracholeplasma palmae]CCV64635.1 23S rRNA (Uracil-5-)-methyltransferase RumA [Alteracholeplasma palmae J233]
MQSVKINDKINLKIKRMGINGEGIAYHEKLAIFIENALPGEEVEAIITQVYDNRAQAKVYKIIKESDQRIDPFCVVYEDCGGCQTQHFDYSAMLDQKKDIVTKSLDRYIKKYDKSVIQSTIGMENPLHYRNKAALPVRKLYGKNRFGMYARNSSTFIPIDDCLIQNENVNIILKTIIKLMDRYDVNGYDPKTKEGFITSLIVRVSEKLDEAQVTFVINNKIDIPNKLIDELIDIHPEIISIYEAYNSDYQKQGFNPDSKTLIYGKETITENLNGHDFEVKTDEFFQLNTIQAEKFYQQMKSMANLNKEMIVLDAYSGVSPISKYVYENVRKIYIIKDEHDSIDVNMTNAYYINKLSEIADNIDVVFFDASRTGLTEASFLALSQLKPKKIIYGSCNPSTLAKDLEKILQTYELKEIKPLDMFPYTSLVESITLLELKETNKDIKN